MHHEGKPQCKKKVTMSPCCDLRAFFRQQISAFYPFRGGSPKADIVRFFYRFSHWMASLRDLSQLSPLTTMTIDNEHINSKDNNGNDNVIGWENRTCPNWNHSLFWESIWSLVASSEKASTCPLIAASSIARGVPSRCDSRSSLWENDIKETKHSLL